jgi:hypothetical protein
MNSFFTEPGVESELIDLDDVPFSRLRELEGAALRRSLDHVLERTASVRVRYKSAPSGSGERID